MGVITVEAREKRCEGARDRRCVTIRQSDDDRMRRRIRYQTTKTLIASATP